VNRCAEPLPKLPFDPTVTLPRLRLGRQSAGQRRRYANRWFVRALRTSSSAENGGTFTLMRHGLTLARKHAWDDPPRRPLHRGLGKLYRRGQAEEVRERILSATRRTVVSLE